ncbi:MAG: DinB family protein, partial [Treponema sp.]|nr:DinB family protein [Treponema sp.]
SRILAFTAEITDADTGSILMYTDSQGVTHERNFGGCLLHFLNHGTYHRGMISVYLEMLGRENDFGSLLQVL